MKAGRAGLLLSLASILCATIAVPALAQEATTPVLTTVQPAIPAPAVYQPQDKDERGLWMTMEEQERLLKTSNFVIRDAALNAYVHDVFCRIAGPRCAEVRIYIMRTPYFNANMAPNGVLQIWSGLLLRVRNEAQLAAVLAHEYVHYQNRHSLMLFRDMKARSASATFFAMFGIVGGLIAIGQLASVFQYSRDMESEADAGSVGLLVKAGYDPMEAARIWEQFRAEADATALARATKSRKDKDGGMFATHPPTAERMAALKALAEKTPKPANAMIRQAEYRTALAPMWPSLVDDQIKLNDFGGTEFLIGYLASDGWTSNLNYARGELYRARGRPDDLTAAAGFYRAASTAPDATPECWRGLGLALLRSGAQPDGRAALKTYLTRRPDASDKAMMAMLAGE